jgi:hypothetical protein
MRFSFLFDTYSMGDVDNFRLYHYYFNKGPHFSHPVQPYMK